MIKNDIVNSRKGKTNGELVRSADRRVLEGHILTDDRTARNLFRKWMNEEDGVFFNLLSLWRWQQMGEVKVSSGKKLTATRNSTSSNLAAHSKPEWYSKTTQYQFLQVVFSMHSYYGLATVVVFEVILQINLHEKVCSTFHGSLPKRLLLPLRS